MADISYDANCQQIADMCEAVLFAAGDPVEKDKLCRAAGVSDQQLEDALNFLKEKYNKSGGIKLLELEGCFQLAAKTQYSAIIKETLEIKKNTILSAAAMETLTVVAYNQPVTKSFVEGVRGVDSSGVVNSLVEKGLLCEAGRLDLPGRPIAYKTTDVFLRSFGLKSLDDLPELPKNDKQITMDDISQEATKR